MNDRLERFLTRFGDPLARWLGVGIGAGVVVWFGGHLLLSLMSS